MEAHSCSLRAFSSSSRISRRDSTLFLASGSTVAVLAETLKPKGRLNIVTTAVNISTMLGENDSISVMQVGGMLYSNTLSVYGNDAIQSVRNIFCSKLFFGIDGFDVSYGITCATREEAELTRQMIQSAEKSIVLCDSSKLGKRGFAHITSLSEIDILITDTELPFEKKKEIEELGVQVIAV